MTTLYVDTSALLKRIFVEPESVRVAAILRARADAGDLVTASELAWVEVSRAMLRAGADEVDASLRAACSGVARYPLDPAVLTRARTIGSAGLRSLDAIHLSAAIAVGAVEMLTFDHRLAEAAEAAGLRVVT